MSSRPPPLYRSSSLPGYSPDIQSHPRRVLARKRPIRLQVEFADSPCVVHTAEGPVHAAEGDAIITGTAGERWSVHPGHFRASYRPVPPTVAGEPGIYVTVPSEVLGVPMKGPFDVLLLDGRSRLHGERGDWLVAYRDGSLGVISQAIFPVTYEIIG